VLVVTVRTAGSSGSSWSPTTRPQRRLYVGNQAKRQPVFSVLGVYYPKR
jgi:hypothetical protein